MAHFHGSSCREPRFSAPLSVWLVIFCCYCFYQKIPFYNDNLFQYIGYHLLWEKGTLIFYFSLEKWTFLKHNFSFSLLENYHPQHNQQQYIQAFGNLMRGANFQSRNTRLNSLGLITYHKWSKGLGRFKFNSKTGDKENYRK